MGRASDLLSSDARSDPQVRGSIPALTAFFRVFESFQGFQPFVFLESYINTSIRNNNSVFRKHTFFVIILTESASLPL